MGKFMNVPDIVLIALTSYLFVSGANWALRSFNRPNLQA